MQEYLEITDKAVNGLLEIVNSKGRGHWLGLRLKISGGIPGAWQSDFRPVRLGEELPDDIVIVHKKLKIYLDRDSAPKVRGAKIDIVPTFGGPSFKIDYPQPTWDDPIEQQLQQLIVERINPGLASHGGYSALLGVKNGVADIVMGGGCQGCGLSAATLRQGIEVMIRESIPEIKEVRDMTDHTAGENPYYKQVSDGEDVSGKSPLVN